MWKMSILLYILLALIPVSWSCHKDAKPTIIQGRITDQKTGEPIAGAFVRMGGKRIDATQPEEYFEASCPDTDAEGHFSCTIEGDYTSSTIGKAGYITHERFLEVTNRQENDIDIHLVPRDGFLRLNIKNFTGQHDSLYVNIFSLIEDMEGVNNGENLKNFPLIIAKGETYTELIDLPSPELIKIRWGFKRSLYHAEFVIQDSISVLSKDTVSYLLSY